MSFTAENPSRTPNPQGLVAAPRIAAAVGAGERDRDDLLALALSRFPQSFGFDRCAEAAGGRGQPRVDEMKRVARNIGSFRESAGGDGDMIGRRDGG